VLSGHSTTAVGSIQQGAAAAQGVPVLLLAPIPTDQVQGSPTRIPGTAPLPLPCWGTEVHVEFEGQLGWVATSAAIIDRPH
jgi:hypothetical protein